MSSINKIEFKDFAERQNSGIPERTETVEEKERAIKAKKAILAHPNCPADTKAELKSEIAAIEAEISAIKAQNMNTSIFPSRNNLG